MHTQHYDIIVSGAGPTGLMLANELSRFGVNFLLLDKKAGPTTESRALVVQARSMEIYEQMGLSDEVEQEGRPATGISLYKKGKPVASVFLGKMGEKISPFPYAMIYEQNKNEDLLYRHLESGGNTVHWNTECTNIIEKDGLYFLDAVQDGTIPARYSCRYLVACDGGKSLVRDFAGMPFNGGTYENVFFVADTHARTAGLSPDMLSLFLTREAITMLLPMKGVERIRLLGALPKKYYHRDDIQFEEIAGEVKKNMQVPVEFYDTQWYSTYKLHYKKVDHFNKGNIFFAGDAAHVHSPAGGQGMNTGLQDAYNLGWKLSLVVKGKASAPLLNSYHEERNPVAEQLLKTTDRLFTVMTNSNNFFAFVKLFVVPRVLPMVNKFKRLRTAWFKGISQTQVNYHT
ncbi:MAG TPA: FAD-dependent monooxygenase, partial [Chitinophagaceae bacterium]